MISVEPLAGIPDPAWDAFLQEMPGGVLYNSIGYRDLLVEHLACEAEYLVARDGGEIRGVLPLMWASDPEGEGRICNSLPFYGSHGGVLAAIPKAEAALLAAWNERATDPSTVAATMVGNPFSERPTPVPVHGLSDERISQVTALPSGATEEDVIAIISAEARGNVRKAQRRGVSVELDNEAIDEVSRIHQLNMASIGGLAKADAFFTAVPAHLRAGEEFDVWVARREDRVVAALLVLRFGGVAEYFASGTEPEQRPHNPHAALLVAAMAHAAQRGCRLWNWGGTWFGQDGVYRFKRKWGADEGRYRYFIQLNDRSLLDATPEQLLARFPHFYVLPFASLRDPVAA